MFIAYAVRVSFELRQERHVEGNCAHRLGGPLNPKHAAPDGAWMVLRDWSSIIMALLTELSRSPIPPKTGENRMIGL
jgi:hypothetical protein